MINNNDVINQLKSFSKIKAPKEWKAKAAHGLVDFCTKNPLPAAKFGVSETAKIKAGEATNRFQQLVEKTGPVIKEQAAAIIISILVGAGAIAGLVKLNNNNQNKPELEPTPTPIEEQVEDISPTVTASPTVKPTKKLTPAPTIKIYIPTPTNTPTTAPIPTSTPTQAPTATPQPTNTPKPTATPTVTPTPAPGIELTAAPAETGIDLEWVVTGELDVSKGYKIVYSENPEPVYPPKSGDKADYWGFPEKTDYSITLLDGKTYFIRVCRYTGSGCDIYSNEVEIVAPAAVP